MQITNPIHKPCPDLACHSLNAQQKQSGLEKLRQVRKALGEKQLEELRSKFSTASRAEKQRLMEKANHIEQVWC